MKIIFQKLIDILAFDFTLLRSRIPYKEKLRYILFERNVSIVKKRNKIRFLGLDFQYDSKYTPITIEAYPKEIVKIHDLINLNKIKSVLDIGANIGQWSFVAKALFPHLTIYSFEPNKLIYDLFKKIPSLFLPGTAYHME